MTRHPPKRVLVLGGGFAGLYATTYLCKAELPEGSIKITLVSENNYFTFLPLLPEVVAGSLGREDVVFPYRVFAASYGFGFLQARVEEVDLERRTVQTDSAELTYDYLVLALGSRPKYFGNDLLAGNSMPLTSVNEAQAIRERVIGMAELAANEPDEKRRRQMLTFVVAGAGPAGVEVAGEIWHLLSRVLPRYFGVETPPRVIIYQGAGRILPGWDERLAELGLGLLRARGIEVHLHTRVQAFDGERVTASVAGQELGVDARTLIWTAGAEPITHPLRGSGLPLGRAGHLEVDDLLTVAGHDQVFAVGDISSLRSSRTRQPYPPVAPIAISQGIRAAANIENAIMGRRLEAYQAHHAGKIVSLGGGVALVDLFGWRLSGFWAWFLYRTTYLMKLVGAKNKVRAVVSLLLSHFFEPDITCETSQTSLYLAARERIRGLSGRPG